jgi:serine/threonine protein kinase
MLTPFDRANELMADALDVPPARRAAFVLQHCGGDAQRHRDVLRLLELYDAAGDLLEKPAVRLGRLGVGDTVANRYLVKAELGRGGMGAVYEVEDLHARGARAMKTLAPQLHNDAEAILQFRAEFLVARGVSHANLCPVFDLVECGGILAFTMARLDGETLAERFARGPVHTEEALRIARGLADGLDALHQAGIVHRDLKPSNIVLVNGVPVIMDFGLAAGPQTRPNGLAGSPDYMAPEQFRQGAANPAADIYAFGLILFEMTTGRRPFPAEDLIAAAIRRSIEDAPLVSDCGGARDWDGPLARALQRNPRARTASAGEVLRQLPASQSAHNHRHARPRDRKPLDPEP